MRLENIKTNLERVFTQEQAEVLAKVIYDSYNDVVKVSDFNELKVIVKELQETVKELAEGQKKLVEAQQKLKKLIEAQKKTEEEIRELVKGLDLRT